MKILTRNFIKLLSVGAFDAKDTVEPMSEYKWKKLLSAAQIYDVSDFICSGIITLCNSGCSVIPSNILDNARNIAAVQSDTGRENKQKTDTIETSGKAKVFSNFYLNRKYNKIVFNEIHSIDTSIDSLVFINKIIENINTLLNFGLDFRMLAELGFYLRRNGDKIDFVKTDGWIKALKAQSITNLIGNYLILLFRFENDELPFVTDTGEKYSKAVSHDIDNMITNPQRRAKTGNNTPRKGINPISRPNTHPIKYKSYCPLESSSRMIANIVKSLSNIDE